MLRLVRRPPTEAVALIAAVLGALAANRPTALVAGTSALVLLRRRAWHWALPLAVAAASSLGAAQAWAGLDASMPDALAGVGRLVTDPAHEYGAVRAEVVLSDRHWDLWARGAEADELAPMSAGQTLWIEARTSELSGRAAPHLRRRHVVGRLYPERIARVGEGAFGDRVANWLRQTVERGASSLPDPIRGLFGGMVLGDDRLQDESTEQRFRAAGLSHLLVVSGQNVAFVLALFSPIVSRGATGARLLATLVVLAGFGCVVRWEPSVMRAVAMAGLVAGSRAVGAAVRPWSVLCVAVTVLLVVDPLLCGSVSFLLSVAASAGLAGVTPLLGERLWGPRWIREALATTLGAQLAVAPVLLAVFGAVPLISVPANLLAAPAAGPAMTWGMAVGLPAGVLGEPAARVLHAPTRLLIGWVDGVSRWAAGTSVPVIRAPGRPPASPVGTRVIAAGGATVVVIDEPRPEIAAELRASGVERIDLLVLTGVGPRALRCAAAISEAMGVRGVLGPADAGPASGVTTTGEARAGPISVRLEPVDGRLEVEVSVASGA